MRWREIISEARRADPREDPEFDQWFKGSQIVDRHGAPLICFHGTNRAFSSFERRAESHDSGIYFTPDHDYASEYATSFQKGLVAGANLRACYLAIRNPVFVLTKPTDIELKIGRRGAFTDAVIAHFEALGHDGIVVGVTDYEVEVGARSVADAHEIGAFHPQQIRSVFEVGQRRLKEAVIIRDRAHSDVDGKLRDLTDEWAKIPTQHMARMLGQVPRLIPS